MRINVSQQLKSSVGSIRKYEINDIIDIAGSKSMVQGEGELIRTNRSILAKGILRTEVEITCSRCLSLSNCPLTITIEEEYFPITDVVSGASLSLPEEPDYFTIDEYHFIDLTEAIRQYALLAIPMKPLCRGDCAGLCSTCGHNLNQGPCDCSPQEIDPRWSELNKLALASDATVNEQKGTK
ncbi:DUF177 domain-containing protein [Chloroflexota bacterium]